MTAHALGLGLTFHDFYDEAEGLTRVDAAFLAHLADRDSDLAARLAEAREHLPTDTDTAALMLALAPHLEAFLAAVFPVAEALAAYGARQQATTVLHTAQRQFVQRRAPKAVSDGELAALDPEGLRAALAARLPGGRFAEPALADALLKWLADPESHADALDTAARYAAWATRTAAGRHEHRDSALFRLARRHDPWALLDLETTRHNGVPTVCGPAHSRRSRDGFDLTDAGHDLPRALAESHYCILCHPQGKDSCRNGLTDRKTGALVHSPLGPALRGCPLEERISEMQAAWRAGHLLAALAIPMVDNPMIAGTGHRICNDCMKACVYQNQHRDPVDIPQVESRIVRDVLALPWGFEILSLLSRWNPMNVRQPLPAPASGYRVLVVGLGPAGYTLAHHLMQQGHTVVAVDGLKLEPLDPALSGVKADGTRTAFAPVIDAAAVREPLSTRHVGGFGGVAEYGITVRWDKNNLTFLRLLLERRARARLVGGVRLGGTLTLDQVFASGFDHVALCLGAGKPSVLPLPDGLAPGVRQASDFLMALQLTGAARPDSLANLDLRLPVVVVGGGLTAIDTATEALAYYPVQVERFRARYETLVAEQGEAVVRRRWSPADAAAADTWLTHARLLAEERARAARDNRPPDFQPLLDQWGGVTIAYRRRLVDSPAYVRNHEEVAKALEEGLHFAELLAPETVERDESGHLLAVVFRRQVMGETGPTPGEETVRLPAATLLVAAGTRPNTAVAREHPDWLALDGRWLQAVDDEGAPVTPEPQPKPEQAHVLVAAGPHTGRVSVFGDLHPSFAGNVVAAMASARHGAPVVDAALRRQPPGDRAAVAEALVQDLHARVARVRRLTPTIVEIVVRAPAAARHFQPGQFYRLQNFERMAPRTAETTLAMEGLALTGAAVDQAAGEVTLIALEMGGSSNLCIDLQPGEPVVLMGPTGAPTEVPAGETVLLLGGGLGNAVLFSIGRALRAAGSRVLYAAGYKSLADRFRVADIEDAADVVLWCCDEAPGFTPNRPQDKSFVGNMVEALVAYGRGDLGETPVALAEVDRLLVIGSDRMMAAVTRARHEALAPYLKPDHVAVGSINSPMQCMMKEICAQCLQTHRLPDGTTRVVFSCFNQDQPLDVVAFDVLQDRLRQNTVQEPLTALWIARERQRRAEGS